MDKLKAKLNQVEAIIKADDFYTKYDSEQRSKYLQQRSDLEFKINKENMNLAFSVIIFALLIRNLSLMKQVDNLEKEVANLKIEPK